MDHSNTLPLLHAAYRYLESGGTGAVPFRTFPVVDAEMLPPVITVYRKADVKRHEVADGRVYAVLPQGAPILFVNGADITAEIPFVDGADVTAERLAVLREAYVLTYHAVATEYDHAAFRIAGPHEIAVAVGYVNTGAT